MDIRRINIQIFRGTGLLLCLFIYSIQAHELELHNPYGAKHHVVSEHFAYWYGDEYQDKQAFFQSELERLEVAWNRLIDDLGFPAPSDDYKVNIYMQDAGMANPPFALNDTSFARAASGDDKYPHIVYHPMAFDAPELLLRQVSAHELFHNIQRTYAGGMLQRPDWFIEASAQWAAAKAWQDTRIFAQDLWALASAPSLSVQHFHQYNGRSAATTHQYAMGLFLQQITDVNDSHSPIDQIMIRTLQQLEDTHYQSGQIGNSYDMRSLGVLKDVAEQEFGVDFIHLFSRYSAKNIFWDYPQGDFYKRALEREGVAQQERFAGWHTTITNDWHTPQNNSLTGQPNKWAASYIYAEGGSHDALEFSFHPHTTASDTQWHIEFVTRAPVDSNVSYQTLTLDSQQKVQAHSISLNDSKKLWISIAVTGDLGNGAQQQRFSYQIASPGNSSNYQQPTTPSTPTPSPPAQQPSSSGGGSVNGWFMLLLICVIYRIIPLRFFNHTV